MQLHLILGQLLNTPAFRRTPFASTAAWAI